MKRIVISILLLLLCSMSYGQGGVRPDQFVEELNPNNGNFEVYSQKGGINRKATLENLKKYYTPKISRSIVYIPTISGNTQNLMEIVQDPNGDVWYISSTGEGIKMGAATGPQGPEGPQGPIGPEGPQGVAGPTGPTGPQGVAGPAGAQGATGPEGPQGIQGPEGPKGDKGDQGDGIQIVGSVPEVDSLDAGYTGSVGDLFIAQDTGNGHVWDGVMWNDIGQIRGPQGIQGVAGPAGADGPQGVQGPQGADGPQGPQGIQGDQGIEGPAGPQGIQGIQGPQGDQGVAGPQGSAGADGDDGLSAYQVWLNEGNSGSEAVFLDSLRGPEGPQGIQGDGIQIVGSVPEVDSLDAGYTGTIGDLFIAQDTGNGHVWDGSIWNNIGQIRGPEGPQGVEGTPKVAENGLSIVSDTVRIGGQLTDTTLIDANVYHLGIESSNTVIDNAPLRVIRSYPAIAVSPIATAIFENKTDLAGGSGYQNEVHVLLKSGTSQTWRRYLNFRGHDNNDDVVFGANAQSSMILYDANSTVHRLFMENTSEGTGISRIASAGTGGVRINQGVSGENVGSGGVRIYDGVLSRAEFIKMLPGNLSVGYGVNTTAGYKINVGGQSYATGQAGAILLQAPLDLSNYNTYYGIRQFDLTHPSGSFTNAIRLGLSAGSNKWNMYVDGTANNYFEGNTGIGVSNPSSKLQVNGTFTSSGTNTLSDLSGVGTRMVVASATGELSTQSIPGGGGSDQDLSISSDSLLITGGTGVHRDSLNYWDKSGTAISYSDNVGIDKVSPASELNVNGVIRVDRKDIASQYLEVSGGTSSGYEIQGIGSNKLLKLASLDSGASAGYNNGISFLTNTTVSPLERMRINKDGQVGIGLTLPQALLDVAGSFKVDGSTFNVDNVNNRVGIGTDFPSVLVDVNNNAISESFKITTGVDGRVLGFRGDLIDFKRPAPSYISASDVSGSLVVGAGGLFSNHMRFNSTNIVVNEGAAAFDFNIRGDTDNNLFYSDGSADAVGIGTNTPSNKLHVVGSIRQEIISEYGASTKFAVFGDTNNDVIGYRTFTPFNFSNGLTESSGSVELGGLLTDDVDVNTGGNMFRVGEVNDSHLTVDNNVGQGNVQIISPDLKIHSDSIGTVSEGAILEVDNGYLKYTAKKPYLILKHGTYTYPAGTGSFNHPFDSVYYEVGNITYTDNGTDIDSVIIDEKGLYEIKYSGSVDCTTCNYRINVNGSGTNSMLFTHKTNINQEVLTFFDELMLDDGDVVQLWISQTANDNTNDALNGILSIRMIERIE
jgi:hypothetical protein